MAKTIARRATPESLRILAFHGVPDPWAFETIVSEVCRHYEPVGEGDVLRALRGQAPLPRYAVWFTFDDGLASTFDAGPILARHGISATIFVCPAVLEDSRHLLWFQVVDACESRDLIGPDEAERYSKQRLKHLPDPERRELTAELAQRLDAVDASPQSGALADLRKWVELGHRVGNHTWDHPMLDQCDPETQREQLHRADAWLRDHGFDPQVFAFPNGNWTEPAGVEAQRLGYTVSLLFDHRLARIDGDPQRMSRLRIDSDAPVGRAMGILSGAHSALFHLSREAA